MAAFREELERLRPYLLRYASLHLRNRDAAEDAVQETLVAALAAESAGGRSGFAGRSNLRTWATGILKHKIVDSLRRSGRERPIEDEDGIDDFDALFDARGHWHEHPDAWPEPDAALQEKEFFAALERCLELLPPRTAQAFMLREHLGLETAEICKELGVTSTHCWVLLYRARMALRECLEKNWFGR